MTELTDPETDSDLQVFPFPGSYGLDVVIDFPGRSPDNPVPAVRLAPGGRAFLVTRYDDAKRVFGDHEVFSRSALGRPESVVLYETCRIPELFLNMDPPEHTRIRRLVARAFTVRAVERLRPVVQQITDELVDAMLAQGPPVDFVAAFAEPLPALVVSELLGVPREVRKDLSEWIDVTLSYSRHTPEEVTQAHGWLGDYLKKLIASRRDAPGDDLVSGLITVYDESEPLTEQELLYTIHILIAGGYETVACLLASSILVLHNHPDQLALLREKPELLPGAIEEILRYVPISWAGLERVALSDVELSGVVVPAGSTVIPMMYSANRDEALNDQPDRFDITRESVSHLSFGHGAHHCVGAPLARLELNIAYQALFSRLPELRPVESDPAALRWKTGMSIVGLDQLYVTW
jgi:cytochrome P450